MKVYSRVILFVFIIFGILPFENAKKSTVKHVSKISSQEVNGKCNETTNSTSAFEPTIETGKIKFKMFKNKFSLKIKSIANHLYSKANDYLSFSDEFKSSSLTACAVMLMLSMGVKHKDKILAPFSSLFSNPIIIALLLATLQAFLREISKNKTEYLESNRYFDFENTNQLYEKDLQFLKLHRTKTLLAKYNVTSFDILKSAFPKLNFLTFLSKKTEDPKPKEEKVLASQEKNNQCQSTEEIRSNETEIVANRTFTEDTLLTNLNITKYVNTSTTNITDGFVKLKFAYVIDFAHDFKNALGVLHEIVNEKDIVIVLINSPGGEVSDYGLAASQLLYFKNMTQCTIIGCVDKIAASGGYMVASVASRIVCAPFSFIGSIGVVTQAINFHDAMQKIGIQDYTIKSGDAKIGITPYNKVTEESIQRVQNESDDIHKAFLSFVLTNRPQLIQSEISNAKVWLGQDALKIGLVDELGISNIVMKKLIVDGYQVIRLVPKKKKPQTWMQALTSADRGGDSISYILTMQTTLVSLMISFFNSVIKILESLFLRS